jgi:hypothetical protein
MVLHVGCLAWGVPSKFQSFSEYFRFSGRRLFAPLLVPLTDPFIDPLDVPLLLPLEMPLDKPLDVDASVSRCTSIKPIPPPLCTFTSFFGTSAKLCLRSLGEGKISYLETRICQLQHFSELLYHPLLRIKHNPHCHIDLS